MCRKENQFLLISLTDFRATISSCCLQWRRNEQRATRVTDGEPHLKTNNAKLIENFRFTQTNHACHPTMILFQICPRKPFVIGYRRSLPKDRDPILTPGGV